jgi:hypothetical protein
LDEFKEVNCTVSKLCFINGAIFLRLSNDLICVAFPEAAVGNRGSSDEVLLMLNYDCHSPSSIKLRAKGKVQVFRNF